MFSSFNLFIICKCYIFVKAMLVNFFISIYLDKIIAFVITQSF